jgi:RNA polymerase sigma-70 factor (ECF subfamily)
VELAFIAALQHLPARQRAVLILRDARARDLVAQFADAFERGDVEQLVRMLVDDATFSMPPFPAWYRGRCDVSKSWLVPAGPPHHLRVVPTRACGQLALGVYALEREAGAYLPAALDVLTVREAHIADVTAFRTPAVFREFDLPDRLPL